MNSAVAVDNRSQIISLASRVFLALTTVHTLILTCTSVIKVQCDDKMLQSPTLIHNEWVLHFHLKEEGSPG